MLTCPLLETARLTLRPHGCEDWNAASEMWAHPDVIRYIGGKPFSRHEVWSKILRYAGHWALLGFGYWAVQEKKSGKFVGELGFANFKRVIEPCIDDAPELGWVLAPEFHGKGYATEALQAVLPWGDVHLHSKRTVCLIDPRNTPSLRVAEKCGYLETHLTTYAGQPTLIFERA